MSAAKDGDKVKVHYTGKLLDGTVFDSSRNEQPFEVTLGASEVIPKFQEAMIGMVEGETKTISIDSQDAYGPKRDDLIVLVPRQELPPDLKPQVGMMLQVPTEDGAPANVIVSDISEESITLDGNHPLAGQNLTFEIELVQIG